MSNAPFLDILTYLDGSEGSLSALMYSIMLSKSTGARLHVFPERDHYRGFNH